MVSISIRCVVKANNFCVDSGIKRNCEYNFILKLGGACQGKSAAMML